MSEPSTALRARIAVVEDDHHLRHDLLDFLNWKGHDAVGCESGEAFAALHARHPVELVLLDIGLPGQDGLSLLASLRQQGPTPAVVMLTSFGADEVRVQGLTEGADAYLIKNTSLEVIEATCLSVLRRVKPQAPSEVPPSDSWHLDAMGARLQVPSGATIELTHMESVFLKTLMRTPGLPVARDHLLAAIGKPSTYNNLRNLDNCATRLRRKVQSNTGLDIPVRACYGQGYAFGEAALVATLVAKA